MHHRSTASIRIATPIPFPPGGYRLYAWSDRNQDLGDMLQQLEPRLQWLCRDGPRPVEDHRGWVAWLPPEFDGTLSPAIATAVTRFSQPPPAWTVRGRLFRWGDRTVCMGVLNVTPDSFSDGGQFTTVARAVERGLEMVAAGADILDIGGESSRPGAETVSLAEELERVVPVICALRQRTQVPISVDTTKAEVLREAIAAGADILNDISAGQLDPDILPAAAQLDVPVILMHMQGTPRTMQTDPVYGNVVDEVYTHLDQRIDAAVKAGVKRERIAVDPGIGFGKTLDHNLELIRRCQEFRSLGCPILMGVSRKSFLGKILDRPEPQQRIWGTAAACSMAIAQGADILRVHDVAEMVDVCRVVDGIVRGDCERN